MRWSAESREDDKASTKSIYSAKIECSCTAQENAWTGRPSQALNSSIVVVACRGRFRHGHRVRWTSTKHPRSAKLLRSQNILPPQASNKPSRHVTRGYNKATGYHQHKTEASEIGYANSDHSIAIDYGSGRILTKFQIGSL
ncbi:hypothetical protein CERZMDRAFT_103086 [Cercospora zeae-maydis SCOH1-5]|uniref:Uncharacterized protein n=1 Tax=Cercospora zeae-maydis SCOH1-5 TaxID=717836 RepID=A0A6A6EZC8_9PEZI|nr:hypothetical protein CERZMDRAFT_103086 [Cercospora zeae-maydis SCOH1-5]